MEKKDLASLFYLGFTWLSKLSHSHKGDSKRHSFEAPELLLLEEKTNEEDFAEVEVQ